MRIPVFLIMLAGIAAAAPASAQNQPPALDSLRDTTIVESKLIDWTIIAVDPNGDVITLFIVPPPDDPVYQGDVVFVDNGGGDGQFQFTPKFDLVPHGQQKAFPIVFSASDGIDTGLMVVTITVVDSNPPPVLQPIADQRVVERDTVMVVVTGGDPDGTIPVLSTSSLPANAFFVDSLNGHGLFFFNPDATQFGIDSFTYDITFYVTDSIDAGMRDSQTITVTVVGPNAPPVLTPIGAKTVTEMDSLRLTISATDANGCCVDLYTSPLPPNAFFTLIPTEKALFRFLAPIVSADTTYHITFYATDGVSIDSESVPITVVNLGNLPPVFEPVDTIRVDENQTVVDTIVAVDPEGSPVVLTLPDNSLSWVTFADNGDGTGILTLSPGFTDGGMYEIAVEATDDESNSVVLTIPVEVIEVDYPPALDSVSWWSLREGQILIDTIIATDQEQIPILEMLVSPDDTAGGKGEIIFRELGDGSALLVYRPSYAFLSESSQDAHFRFYARDRYDVDSQQMTVTVYNVAKHANDSLDADTLTFATEYWDGQGQFAVHARVWHDAPIGTAMTGFRWGDTLLECDTVVIDPSIVGSKLIGEELYRDSLRFLAWMYFYNLDFWSPPGGAYFTARFHYRGEWTPGSALVIDSAQKVGSSSGFGFDKKINDSLSSRLEWEEMMAMAENPYFYQPLFTPALVLAAFDSVRLSVYDVARGRTLTAQDTIFTGVDGGGEPLMYQLRLSLENDDRLGGISLGVRAWTGDGATWTWAAQPLEGLGDHQAVTVLPGRMTPHTEVWSNSGGLTVGEVDIDGTASDTLVINGSADYAAGEGLAAGLMQPMVALHFIPGTVPDGEVRTIAFDSATVTGSGEGTFTDSLGTTKKPGFGEVLSFPVVHRDFSGIHHAEPPIPKKFELSQNYPNPFNPSTTIRFTLPRREHVTLVVYNILGQMVKTLADRTYDAGEHAIVWDGRDETGRPTASGVYLYRIVGERFSESKKMILLK